MGRRPEKELSPFDYAGSGELTVSITLSEYRELLRNYLTFESEAKSLKESYENEMYQRDCQIEKLKVKLNRAMGVE